MMTTVTKAQTLKTDNILIICVSSGQICNAETARQPVPVRAIKTEMTDPKFIVRIDVETSMSSRKDIQASGERL